MTALHRLCMPATVTVLLSGLVSPALRAQATARLFPSRRLLPRLVAAPREPVTHGKLIMQLDSPTRFDEIVEGEAALGTALPVYLLSGTERDGAVVLGLEGGVFGRFNMETRQRDIITSDWVFGLPVVWWRGDHWVRLRYVHVSSHLGDEYIERFDVARVPFSRDAVELVGLVQTLDLLGIYAGARWAFRVDPNGSRRLALRAGTHLEGNGTDGFGRPYLAADVELDQDVSWDPRVNVQAGVSLITANGRPDVRLHLEFFTGPAPLGQFARDHATFVTLGASLGL